MGLMEGRNDIGQIGDGLDMQLFFVESNLMGWPDAGIIGETTSGSCMLLQKAITNVFIAHTGCAGSISRPTERVDRGCGWMNVVFS
jgi:hypothetical protein